MFRSLFVLGFACALSMLALNCAGTSSTGLTIKGKVTDASDLRVFFDRLQLVTKKIDVISQAELNGSGKYTIQTDKPLDAGIYRIRIGNRFVPLILNGSEKSLQITGSLGDMDAGKCIIKGSEESTKAHQLLGQMFNKEIGLAELRAESIKAQDPLAALYYAFGGITGSKEDVALLKNIVINLRAKYPKSTYTSDLDNMVTSLERDIATRESTYLIKEGSEAPNISLPDPEGKNIELKSLRGKVVLLDFWASWCGPCRRENPNVVNIYNKYKDKGFTVYSVSLDRPGAKENWKEAIAADHLTWPNHVSDLQHWNSAAGRTYGIQSIPQTFLLNKEGVIVATNLRGEALEPAIKKYL
ncbi:MAG: TlpA disulfide reductase family protein [Saprospiraceae bacterium]